MKKVMKKMKNKMIKTGMLVLALAAGYTIGSAGKKDEPQKVETEKNREEKNVDRRIAVVNLDEGIVQGETNVQYAAQMLNYSGVDYTVTGLQDARNGIETGLYSAYVVIPPGFSRTVYSLNEQPAVSCLSYTLSNELNETERQKAAREVEKMQVNLNKSLTKTYLSSILKEFHSVQDVSSVIMENDAKDAQTLNEVNAGSLIAMVELPPLTQVENHVTPLDLTEQYTGNEALTSSLDSAYKNYMAEGQEALDQTKKKSDDVTAEMNSASLSFQSANDQLNGIHIAEENEYTEENYQELKEKHQQAEKFYEDYIERYNANQVANANAGKEALRQGVLAYEQTEKEYQNMLQPFWSSRQCYEFMGEEQYEQLLEDMAMLLAETDPASAPPMDWQQWLTTLYENLHFDDYCISQAAVQNQTLGEDEAIQSEEYMNLEEVLNLSEKENAEAWGST